MTGHVITTAFTVNAETWQEAERRLADQLPMPHANGDDTIEEWWIADDRRSEGSDNDSAVFVPQGSQAVISQALVEAGLTPECNLLVGGVTPHPDVLLKAALALVSAYTRQTHRPGLPDLVALNMMEDPVDMIRLRVRTSDLAGSLWIVAVEEIEETLEQHDITTGRED